MTPQEIFDTVATHLFAQGKRALSIKDTNNCAYRAPAGSKCAVGCLIPDDVYTLNMEGVHVSALFYRWPALPEWMSQNRRLLSFLQQVHDDPDNWITTATMRKALKNAVWCEQTEIDTAILDTLSFKDR